MFIFTKSIISPKTLLFPRNIVASFGSHIEYPPTDHSRGFRDQGTGKVVTKQQKLEKAARKFVKRDMPKAFKKVLTTER